MLDKNYTIVALLSQRNEKVRLTLHNSHWKLFSILILIE